MTRFVVRLLSEDDQLMAWSEVMADPSPQPGRASTPLYARPGLTKFLVEQSGTVTKLVIHWPEIDVARMTAVGPLEVSAGQTCDFVWIEPVWLVLGMKDVPLPAVTVRAPVALGPSSAGLGMKDSRVM